MESDRLLRLEKGLTTENQYEFEPGEVNDVETFLDLIVGVAVGKFSDKLYDAIIDARTSSSAFPWLRFLIQSFMLWYVWQSGMVLTNLGNMLTRNKLTYRHYVTVFGLCGFIVLFMKACEGGNYSLGALSIISCRALVALGLYADATLSSPPVWMNRSRWNCIRKYTRYLLWASLVEFGPVVISVAWAAVGNYTDEERDEVLATGSFVMVLLVLGRRWFRACQYDYEISDEETQRELLDVEHMQERYSLVTFVVLGQLCCAPASQAGAYWDSLAALITAVDCFLLYFTARVEGRKEPWVGSASSRVFASHVHIGLFCVIPSIGVAYQILIAESTSGNAITSPWYMNAHILLGVSSSLYLFYVGVLDLLTEDPLLAPRIKRNTRVLVQFLMAAFIAIATQKWNAANMIVPVCFSFTATLLVWGCQPKR